MLQRVFISLLLIVSGCEASLTTNYDVDPTETPDLSSLDSSSDDVGLLDMDGIGDMPAEIPDQGFDLAPDDMLVDMVTDMVDSPEDMVDSPEDMAPEIPDQSAGPVCGNGVIEAPETCDGNCPQSCEAMACQTASLSGTPQNCDVECSYQAIATCTNDDGCCAPGCNATNDNDCEAICGNNVVEAPEICDGNCPAQCTDNDACTVDSSVGSAGTCDRACSFAAITSCTDGDGCCAPGCNANNDDDCVVDCRNPASWPTGWVTYEQEVVTLLNQYRSSPQNCGTEGTFSAAGPLVMSPTLREASRCHSVDMGVRDTLTHTGSDGSSFSQRASAAGYTGFAANENAGKGYSTPASVVQGWMNSDGHCANVMNPNINRVGVGYYLHATSGRWWTMVGGINGN